MLFTHDTEIALAEAAALVNTLSDGVDELETPPGLDAFLERFPYSGVHRRTADELDSGTPAARPAAHRVGRR